MDDRHHSLRARVVRRIPNRQETAGGGGMSPSRSGSLSDSGSPLTVLAGKTEVNGLHSPGATIRQQFDERIDNPAYAP